MVMSLLGRHSQTSHWRTENPTARSSRNQSRVAPYAGVYFSVGEKCMVGLEVCVSRFRCLLHFDDGRHCRNTRQWLPPVQCRRSRYSRQHNQKRSATVCISSERQQFRNKLSHRAGCVLFHKFSRFCCAIRGISGSRKNTEEQRATLNENR